MIEGRDSSIDRPTPAQARAAYAAGVRVWGGYLGTRPAAELGLVAVWSREDFAVVQDAGLSAIGFCSGWDDPATAGQLARAWDVRPLLDDEDGIRLLTTPDWRPAWLSAAGAGLYGVAGRQNIAAPWRIVAEYPDAGCPGAAWPAEPEPAEPHGWQCQGTHIELGLSVDRIVLTDSFVAAAPAPAIDRRNRMLQLTYARPALAPEDTWVDVLDVDAATGILRHSAYEPATLAATVEAEQLPGTWLDLVAAPGFGWSPDGSALHVLGVGQDHTLWTVTWTPAAGWTDGPL